MSEVTTIGLDIAKNVFHAQGADTSGSLLFSRKISRTKVLEFFAKQPSCLVALEACGGAHHWARELTLLGHQVRLIPPAYVRPFVKRNKNDAVDAEAKPRWRIPRRAPARPGFLRLQPPFFTPCTTIRST